MFCCRSALLDITAIIEIALRFYLRTALAPLATIVLQARRWRTRTNVHVEHSVIKLDWRTKRNVVHVRAVFIVLSGVNQLFPSVVMLVGIVSY